MVEYTGESGDGMWNVKGELWRIGVCEVMVGCSCVLDVWDRQCESY